MFALELGRYKDSKPITADDVQLEKLDKKTESKANEQPILETIKAKNNEISALQNQLEVLKKQLVTLNDTRATQKVVIAKTQLPKLEKELQNTTVSGGGIIVKFLLDAVTLSTTEAETVRNELGPVVSSGSARIEVTVPEGFSEAKRIGFYRAMAVRNLLIEMNLAPDKIEVSVLTGKSSADNSKVIVSPR
jgi:hypothetical protein